MDKNEIISLIKQKMEKNFFRYFLIQFRIILLIIKGYRSFDGWCYEKQFVIMMLDRFVKVESDFRQFIK